MGKAVSVVFGAIIYVLVSTIASADTVQLALRAPLPSFSAPLAKLPTLEPVNFAVASNTISKDAPVNIAPDVEAQADISAFGFPCEAQLISRALPNAMVHVAISAPCKPRERIVLSYDGIEFDDALSLTGAAVLIIPALTTSTRLTVTFEDGERLLTETRNLGVDAFMRLALEWPSPNAPTLSSHSPRHLPVQHMTLGDKSGRIVQIISHHIDPDVRPGVIRLSMTREVRLDNCAMAQTGKVSQISSGVLELHYDLNLAAPGCDKIGRTIELKNVLQDLKLAAN